MRKLRIVGVEADSSVVECEVPASGEKFTLPLDDRFRAAARGEYLASDAAERRPVTGTLRPREIQDRIRHGATAEEVATDAGVPLSRIEGFAVPVLLERASAADLAKNAHPMLHDGPALNTLAERVGAALDRRGVDPDLATWDAWRDRSGGWVVRTSWPAGLSDDASATWSFVPDSHGGSARALDQEAEGLLDPARATALRSVSSPPPLPSAPPPIRSVAAPVEAVPDHADNSGTDDEPAAAPVAGPDERDDRAPHGPTTHGPTPHGPANHERATHDRATDAETGHDDEDFLQHPPAAPERRSSRRHPTMPSWEDVLLGVRGKDD